MPCNRIIGETLVNEFLATNTLMSFLMKAGLSWNIFWQGTSKPLPPVVDLFQVSRHSGLYSAFVWLKIFPGNCLFQVSK